MASPTTTPPVILTSEPDIDHLHTVEFVADDDTLYVHDQADDCVGHALVTLAWPVERVPAICAAMMRAVQK